MTIINRINWRLMVAIFIAVLIALAVDKCGHGLPRDYGPFGPG